MSTIKKRDLAHHTAIRRVYDVRELFEEIKNSYAESSWPHHEQAFASLFEARIEHLEEIAAVCAPAQYVLAHALELEEDLAIEYKILSARNKWQRLKSLFFGKNACICCS